MRHGEQVVVTMKQELSDRESHALCCPVKNAKGAMFVVASFSVIAFVSWKGLNKPQEHHSLPQLLFAIFALAVAAQLLVKFTCFRERLLLGIAIINLLTMEVQGFAPSVFSKHVELVKSVKFASVLLGLFVSLTMLVQAVRSPNVKRAGGTPLNS
jgi:hypothetical protein